VKECLQEIESVVSEYSSEIDFIIIGDDIFGPDTEWRREFCEQYKERILDRYGVRFQILMRVEMFQSTQLPLMLKEAGCFKVSFGVESGDEEQRREILDRHMSDKKLIKAFEICRAVGLETTAINIIGFPDESVEMIQKTIKLNRILKPTSSGVNIFYPYKGTPLGDRCFSDDLVDLEKFATFSTERRDSVLKFPEAHLQLLLDYQRNWQYLIHPIFSYQGLRIRFTDVVEKFGLLPLARKIYPHVKRLLRRQAQAKLKGAIRPGRAA
jgi:radical SAM superfamily enzyme YgiQ (UPF0313 family)